MSVPTLTRAPVLAATGQTAEAIKVAESGFADHMILGDELAMAHPATHVANQAYALAELDLRTLLEIAGRSHGRRRC